MPPSFSKRRTDASSALQDCQAAKAWGRNAAPVLPRRIEDDGWPKVDSTQENWLRFAKNAPVHAACGLLLAKPARARSQTRHGTLDKIVKTTPCKVYGLGTTQILTLPSLRTSYQASDLPQQASVKGC
jgi:hypothetical protein